MFAISPNWCTNDLVITGPKASVEKLVEFVKGDANGDAEARLFDFGKVIPYPEEYRIKDDFQHMMSKRYDSKSRYPSFHGCRAMPISDGYNHGGYEWCCNNWGTKWNARVENFKMLELGRGEAEAYYNMDTAWSPPMPVLATLSEKFPDIEMLVHFVDEGGGFEDEVIIKDGKGFKVPDANWKFRSSKWEE